MNEEDVLYIFKAIDRVHEAGGVNLTELVLGWSTFEYEELPEGIKVDLKTIVEKFKEIKTMDQEKRVGV